MTNSDACFGAFHRRSFHQKVLGLASTGIFALGRTGMGSGFGKTGKLSDIRVVEASCETENVHYRSPLKIAGRVITDMKVLHVRVKVESRAGKVAEGSGSMSVGNIWAWRGTTEPDKTEETMLRFCEKLAEKAPECGLSGHPLEWTYDYAGTYDAVSGEIALALKVEEAMPQLAQLVAASPLDAAVFDAYGKLHGANVYHLLSKEYCNRDLSFYLNEDFKDEYLNQYTLRTPRERMPNYILAGSTDPLSSAEVSHPIGDGLPEHLGEWIHSDGATHVMIKMLGDNLDWDVNRMLAVNKVAEEVQAKRGCSEWFYCADFNEKCENVQYVLDFFDQVKRSSPAAFERLQFIEQPTHRDLKAFPNNRMHEATRIKPVAIDESLVDFESLQDSRKMGYSGVVLKSCKGQGQALLMAAAAQKYKLFLCVGDLTCCGTAFLQSASLAARVPTVTAIVGVARQLCPAANAPWIEKFPSIFTVNDGNLHTSVLNGQGLY